MSQQPVLPGDSTLLLPQKNHIPLCDALLPNRHGEVTDLSRAPGAALPFSTSCLQRRAHSVSCWAYAFSMRARSCRQFMRSLHRRWPSSIRFTVRL